jgi:AhpD family alkylhydroperoxidase
MTVHADARTPTRRVSLTAAAPEVFGAMVAFGQAAQDNLDPVVAALVKIRCSQLNGCAYCLDMHSREARAAGESEQRLDTLAAWRSTPFFTDREESALALAEAITLVADTAVPDDVYEAAARHFDETELAHLLWTIAAINAWNRVSVATRMAPSR